MQEDTIGNDGTTTYPVSTIYTPIFGLPSEILLEIVRVGLCEQLHEKKSSRPPAATSYPQVLFPSETPFQLLISHVCQRWRAVALHTPLLWTRIDIGAHALPFLEACLTRSYPCLLDIYIHADDVDRPHRPVLQLKPSLALVLPEISRWRRLVVTARFFSSVLHIHLALRHKSAPALEHLALCLGDPFGLEELWRDPEDAYLEILGGGAPRLKEVNLWGVSLHYCHPPLDGVTLTTLALTTPFDSEAALPLSYAKLRQVLASASSLTRLALHGRVLFHHQPSSMSSVRHAPRRPLEPVIVPSLRVLEISAPADTSSAAQCDYLLELCASIKSPVLTSLSLNFLGRVQAPPFLQSLRIHSPTSPDTPLLRKRRRRATGSSVSMPIMPNSGRQGSSPSTASTTRRARRGSVVADVGVSPPLSLPTPTPTTMPMMPMMPMPMAVAAVAPTAWLPRAEGPFPGLDLAHVAEVLVARAMAALHPAWSALRTIDAHEVDEYRLFRVLGAPIGGGDQLGEGEQDGEGCERGVREVVISNWQQPVDRGSWVDEQLGRG
ncbi:hypothetical protein HGRIS_013849 [Hohenbuehelia grisea]|uniref:F-box domain-containing protein n=1 Tax=Hohenbuehelia grisea TaxID=104357 RepID=A0ABR3IX02_9AGAR